MATLAGLAWGAIVVVVIQSYAAELAAVHATNADVKLSVQRESALGNEAVLSVDYPAPTGNPAGRDVWCDAENTDWSGGKALSFRIKADHPLRLSMSFLDRNGVAYTSWVDVAGPVWQEVRIAFDAMRPNPYFQPPGANTKAPIDVSRVGRIGFAPQDQTAGRFTIGRIVVE
jgi:hypothetical protein